MRSEKLEEDVRDQLAEISDLLDQLDATPLGELQVKLNAIAIASNGARIAFNRYCDEPVVSTRDVTREFRLRDENDRLRAEVADLKAQRHVELA